MLSFVFTSIFTAKRPVFSTVVLTFLHTVINCVLLSICSAGNLIYTCKGYIRSCHTITLTSLITTPRPHLGVSPGVEGAHRPDLI